MKISAFDAEAVKDLFAEMEAEATAFVRSCDAEAAILADHKVYMRYAGQGWEIPVPLTPEQAAAPDPATILTRFEEDYATLFGRKVDGMEAEITVWSVNATTPPARIEPARPVAAQSAATPTGERRLFDAAQGDSLQAAICPRAALSPGASIDGPAVITEDETTIVLPASRRALALSDGCVDMHERKG